MIWQCKKLKYIHTNALYWMNLKGDNKNNNNQRSWNKAAYDEENGVWSLGSDGRIHSRRLRSSERARAVWCFSLPDLGYEASSAAMCQVETPSRRFLRDIDLEGSLPLPPCPKPKRARVLGDAELRLLKSKAALAIIYWNVPNPIAVSFGGAWVFSSRSNLLATRLKYYLLKNN